MTGSAALEGWQQALSLLPSFETRRSATLLGIRGTAGAIKVYKG
jgi:hypothetical protein